MKMDIDENENLNIEGSVQSCLPWIDNIVKRKEFITKLQSDFARDLATAVWTSVTDPVSPTKQNIKFVQIKI